MSDEKLNTERPVQLMIQADPDTQSRLMTMLHQPTGVFLTIELSADEAWVVAQALVKNVTRPE